MLPHNIESTDYCDVTSPYMYSNHGFISVDFGDINVVSFFGLQDVLATAGGHAVALTDGLFWFPALGFRFVFHSNHSYKHRFWASGTGQTDRRTTASFNAPLVTGHNKHYGRTLSCCVVCWDHWTMTDVTAERKSERKSDRKSLAASSGYSRISSVEKQALKVVYVSARL